MTFGILQSALAFVLAVGVLVTVHELGHFWVARRLGVKVLRFSVGFGRPLWIRRGARDGTEYVLSAIPLGGYVKMLDEREAPVAAADRARAFNRQGLWVRSAIVAAGPLANFGFAVVAYWLTFVIGVAGTRPLVGEVTPGSPAASAGVSPGTTVVAVAGRETPSWESVVQAIISENVTGTGSISLRVRGPTGAEKVRWLDLGSRTLDDLGEGQFFRAVGLAPARPVIPPVIGELTAGAPAERDGLRPRDRIVSADGVPIERWSEWVRFVRGHPERPVALVVDRMGRRLSLTLVPDAVETRSGVIGRIGARAWGVEKILAAFSVTQRYTPWEGFGRAISKTYDVSALTLGVFWKMLTFQVSVRNLSGPISIAQYAGYSAGAGFVRFLEFLAIVSVSLGILNLLPIPVLDGGHLLFYAVEWVSGRPVSERVQILGQQVGIAVLVGLMSVAFYNDVARLFG